MKLTRREVFGAAIGSVAFAKSAPASKVAIARCRTYDSAMFETLKKTFDQIGGLGPIVKNKTVALKPGSFIAPGVELAFESAARGSFPLGFGWKSIDLGGSLSQPLTVSSCVEPTDARDRLIGMIETRVGPSWRCFVAGVLDEELIELIRDREASDREFVNKYSMNRAFVDCARIATHQELTGRNDDHFWFDVHRVEVRRKMNRIGSAGDPRRYSNLQVWCVERIALLEVPGLETLAKPANSLLGSPVCE